MLRSSSGIGRYVDVPVTGTSTCPRPRARCDAHAVTAVEHLIASVAASPLDADATARALAEAALSDTLAIGVAGMGEHATRTLRSVLVEAPGGVRTWSGPQEYAVSDVALVHGTACHALDWDDYMHPMHGHGSSVLLPAVWGLAEQRGLSGAQVIDSFLVGYQVDYLVALVLSHGHYRRGWHATSTIGAIGAAAAAAHLLELDVEQTSAALGIAASSASGLQVNFGTPTKALHAGLAARAGVQATLLARAGMTSAPRGLTGMHGMLAAFGGDTDPADAYDLVSAGIAAGHGITTAMGLVQKPYTSCGCSHAAVDAVVSVTGDLDPADIDRIEVHVDPAVTRTMRESVPADAFDSRYSVSWVVAVAAADGTAGPTQFDEVSIRRTDVLALRERVEVIPDLAVGDDDRFGARVVVHAHGEVREAMVPYAQGHPLNPMDEQRRTAKQRMALALVTGEPDRIVTALATLPDLADVRELGALLRSL